MCNWRKSTWGEEISLEYGKGIRGYADAKGPVRVFGTNGPVGWTSEPIAPGPGIILGRKGAYRGVHYSPDPFFVIDTAYYVVPKTELNMRWLYYAIIYYKLGEIDDGSPIPSTTRAAVYVRDLKVPSFLEQERIASILGTLDDKIDLNRRMNETLEAMARAIFKDWFVDFGPTRAKMEGREAYLAPEIWELFPDRMDGEEKPEGWKKELAGDIYDINIGRTPPRKETEHFLSSGHGRPWLSIKTMGNAGLYIFETQEDLTPTAIEKFRIPLVPQDTVMVSFKLTVGRVAIAGCDMHTNEAIAQFGRQTKTPVSSEYLYCYLKEFDFGSLGSTSSIATAVNSKSIKQIPILFPDETLSVAFDETVRSLFRQIRANIMESSTLAQTRDLLLPKLMSGEIRVNEAEKHAGGQG